MVNFAKTADSVSGPVAIVAVGAEVARADATGLFQFAAIVNINLAVVNLLPLPVRGRTDRMSRSGSCVLPCKRACLEAWVPRQSHARARTAGLQGRACAVCRAWCTSLSIVLQTCAWYWTAGT